MKDGIKSIVGKKIVGVLTSEGNAVEPPTQVFLLFDDETYFELYGVVHATGGVDRGGLEVVTPYAKQFGGTLKSYGTPYVQRSLPGILTHTDTPGDAYTAKVLIKVNVAYPADFIITFEGQRPSRRGAGELKYSSAADADTPNFIYIIADWQSVDAARHFWFSGDAKRMMQLWGAVTTPEIKILAKRVGD